MGRIELGSHRCVEASHERPKLIVETTYTDLGGDLMVRTTYRGKNSFGAVVQNWVKARVSVDGTRCEIIANGVGP